MRLKANIASMATLIVLVLVNVVSPAFAQNTSNDASQLTPAISNYQQQNSSSSMGHTTHIQLATSGTSAASASAVQK